MLGYSLTSAPLVVKDKVLVGITGGEFGARGFLDAYDAATGKRLWRWYAVPAPGEFGNDTWKGDSWKIGGSPMWLTGSLRSRAQHRLLDRRQSRRRRSIARRAATSTTCSATRSSRSIPTPGSASGTTSSRRTTATTGIRAQDVILVDRVWHGQTRKLLLHADRNGIFYVLDRTNGAFLAGTPFVYQNWNTGFDANGRPRIVPGSNSSREGSFFVYPTLGGGTNFQAPSYSPLTGWFYLAVLGERPALRQRAGAVRGGPPVHRPRPRRAGPPSAEARRAGAVGGHQGARSRNRQDDVGLQDLPGLADERRAGHGRQRACSASMRDGNSVALDARTGAHLWHFQTGDARRVADELRDRRPAVRRDRGRQHGLRVRAARVDLLRRRAEVIRAVSTIED